MSTARGPMPASTLSGAAAEMTRKTTPHVPRAAFFRPPVFGLSSSRVESMVTGTTPLLRAAAARPGTGGATSECDAEPRCAQSIVQKWCHEPVVRIAREEFHVTRAAGDPAGCRGPLRHLARNGLARTDGRRTRVARDAGEGPRRRRAAELLHQQRSAQSAPGACGIDRPLAPPRTAVHGLLHELRVR